MEGRYNLRPRASGRVQTNNTRRPQHYVPPAGVPPSSDVNSLRQALLSAEECNMKLASENAALRQQFANLQGENHKLMHENRCLQGTLGRKLHMAKQSLAMCQTEVTKAGPDHNNWEERVREKERQLSSLGDTLSAQKEETEKVRDSWMKDCDKMKEKEEKKESRRGFWGKKKEKCNSDEEASVFLAQTGQEQKEKDKIKRRRSLWSKKKQETSFEEEE
ncbi:golgin subfamily A member 6-like protein 2 [Seriola lalandi dorsalis]|uniref:golgin subfamily A member 6-like protein 2 n=1 Tax=Seriola lalandi dorsalis TaxID=1841481 RepID=UPI000C6F485A|nr:golgin subfamily A member 6-like protein 2 [Seriola lalandi dorsalis]